MRTARITLGVAGGLLIAFGAVRLVTTLEHRDLLVLLLWLGIAVAVHDLVLAPLTVGTGVLLTRVPARARRYLQGGLVAGALVTVVAIPLIGRRGTQPDAKALLLRDYLSNLLVLLTLVAAVASILFLRRLVSERR